MFPSLILFNPLLHPPSPPLPPHLLTSLYRHKTDTHLPAIHLHTNKFRSHKLLRSYNFPVPGRSISGTLRLTRQTKRRPLRHIRSLSAPKLTPPKMMWSSWSSNHHWRVPSDVVFFFHFHELLPFSGDT